MTIEVNPFDQVFSALWGMVVEHPAVTALVKPGNMIRFDQGDRDPSKDTIASADVPEITLVQDGLADINLHDSSCTSRIRRRYVWMIHSGDNRLKIMNPVQWALLCAMCDWKAALGPLSWNGTKFVKELNFVDAREGQSDAEQNRGLKGWSTAWGVNVGMNFKTSDLIAFTGA